MLTLKKRVLRYTSKDPETEIPSCCRNVSRTTQVILVTLANITATSRRTAKLEQRLDDLVALLAARQQPSSPSQTSTNAGSEAESFHQPGYISNLPSKRITCSAEMVKLLELYRVCLTPNFPFILIPEGMPPHELQQQSPHLFESILMVASYSNSEAQSVMARAILQNLTTSIIIKGEASLDLLQAILVYNAWYVKPSYTKRQSVQSPTKQNNSGPNQVTFI